MTIYNPCFSCPLLLQERVRVPLVQFWENLTLRRTVACGGFLRERPQDQHQGRKEPFRAVSNNSLTWLPRARCPSSVEDLPEEGRGLSGWQHSRSQERKSFGCEGRSGLHLATCTSAFIKRPSSWIRADGELGLGCTGSRQQLWAQPLQGSVSLG